MLSDGVISIDCREEVLFGAVVFGWEDGGLRAVEDYIKKEDRRRPALPRYTVSMPLRKSNSISANNIEGIYVFIFENNRK